MEPKWWTEMKARLETAGLADMVPELEQRFKGRGIEGLAVGSIVQLKSGGPTMTVVHIKPGDEDSDLIVASVTWWDDGFGADRFPLACLVDMAPP